MKTKMGYAHVVDLRDSYLKGKRTKPKRCGMEKRWRTPGCVCEDASFAIWDGHQWELDHLGYRYGLWGSTIHWLLTCKETMPKVLWKELCRLVHWHEQLLGRAIELKELQTISSALEEKRYWDHYWYEFNERRQRDGIHQVRASGQDVDEEPETV